MDPLSQFAATMDHMAECVRTGATPMLPGEEGLRDVRLIRAIYAAAEAGRWLDLKPDGTLAG